MPLAGQRVKALDFTPAVKSEDLTTFLNISTTLTVGVPEVGVVFTAPTSGKVNVTVTGSVAESGGTTAAAVIDWKLFLGTNSSGTLILNTGSLLRRLILFGNTQAQEAGRTSLVTGLTAGSSYYVQVLHASYGTLVDLFARSVAVTPLPA